MEMSKNSTVSYEYLQDYVVLRKEKMFKIIYSHKYILIGYNIIFKSPQIKKKCIYCHKSNRACHIKKNVFLVRKEISGLDK